MLKVHTASRRIASSAAPLVVAATIGALVLTGCSPASVPEDPGSGGLTVEDRLDILDLYARYSIDLDGGKADDFATNVFAPDGVFHDPDLCVVGTEELHELAEEHGEFQRSHTFQHMPSNILIEGEGDTATGRAYIALVSQDLGDNSGFGSVAAKVVLFGTYTDEFVKIDGQWLFQSREVWRPGEITVDDPRCSTDLESLE